MPKFIVSGGGTGGHIFPAVAIAKELQRQHPGSEILFVGAQGRMEMEKVPAEGFDIVGLPIEGLKRSLTPRNFVVLAKAVYSLIQARKLLKSFKPDAVIGTGGYASLPVCRAAAGMGIPTFLQEQNGFAGLTNKTVGPKARHIFTGFPDMDRFFAPGTWTFTGNPVRENILQASVQGEEARLEALKAFGLSPDRPVLFVTGGSLGARTLNQALHQNLDSLHQAGIQLIWQMGKTYAEQHLDELKNRWDLPGFCLSAFVYNMDQAYLAADLVIGRAGALSVSEIAVMNKASLLVPSPNVTDDHQTQNAKLLSEHGAAQIVLDSDAQKHLVPEALRLLSKPQSLAQMRQKLQPLARPTATQTIASSILKSIGLATANPKCVYFLGIGGIGMSAIARYYLQTGWKVAGYDKTPSPLTQALQQEGMQIGYDDHIQNIPEDFRQNASQVLWVLTPAVPHDHPQRQWVQAQGLEWQKRSEVLGLLAQDHYTIAIAGTHGKTTTSTLVAHLLKESGAAVTAFLGGISSNFGSNYLHTEGQGPRRVVLEADEFDRSFHRLNPDLALITAMDADHLDIYGSPEAFHQAFVDFAHKLRKGGSLLLQEHLTPEGMNDLTLLRYGLNPADYRAENVRVEDGEYHFDFVHPQGRCPMHCGLPGRHNVENAVGALGICCQLGIAPESLSDALSQFKGAKRRFERLVKGPTYTLIDDYAHHPQELNAFIASVRELYPAQKLTGIFQPHLFSRTRDFAQGFADSLSALDELWLMPIYPARELPMQGVSSEWLKSLMPDQTRVHILGPEAILEKAAQDKPELLLIMGAGDVDRLCPPLTELYQTLNSPA